MAGTLSTAIASVTAVLDEECIITGRSAAYCNYTYIGDSSGSTTSTSYTTIINGSLYYEYPVTITAGAEKLSLVVETSSPGGATPSASNPSSVITSGSTGSFGDKMRVLAVVSLFIHCFPGLAP